MATTLQLRRGTATEAAAFTGAVGELFIDTQNKLVYLHDGVTAGGVLVGGSGGSGSAVVSGTVSGNTLTLTNSDSSTVNINVATLAQDTDTNTYVTSATVSGSVITLHNNNGSTVNIQLPSSVTGFLPGEVSEDILPQFDAVYDLGSPAERWYDVNVANSVKIGAATLSEVNGVLTVNTELVANNLTGTDLVANEALIGTVLHTGSTITPEGTPLEYGDIKGTLTVDGNLIVADDLSVRNKIALKQTPQNVGNVTGFTINPEVSTPVYLTDSTAQAAGLQSIYFTSGGNIHSMNFSTAQQAAAFNTQLSVGQQVIFGFVVQGQGAFTTTVTIASKTYNGAATIDFSYNYVSGIEFNQFANWTYWYFPWASNSQYQMNSISFTSTTPATYAVQFDSNVPALNNVSKIFINGTSTVEAPVSFASLNAFVDSVQAGASMYLNNISFYNDGVYGTGFVLSMMTSTTPFYDYLASANTMTFTSSMTGITWELDIVGVEFTPTYGTWVKYNIISTTNPSYPRPDSVQQSYVGSVASVSLVMAVDIKTYLTSSNTTVTASNEYTSNSDISTKFAIGDAVTYTTKTTKLVFGDEAGTLSKAITYDEVTGDISYGGLVSAINYDTAKSAIYSSNAQTITNLGTRSISIGAYAKGAAQDSIAIGYYADSQQPNSISIGDWSKAKGQNNVSIGHGESGGQYSTYVGPGGSDMGNMYHSTVLGMQSGGSSGWMWASGQHVMVLGLQSCYINQAGDYATVINGGGGNYVNSNLLGGSTWFATQSRHAEIKLSVYQYKYSNGAATIYPQLGYTASASMPMDIPTSGSSSSTSTFDTKLESGLITQGKVTVTVQRRNSDDYGIYEIAFVTRNNNSGTASIVQQTTTVVAQSGAATYWNNPVMYLHNDRYLQLSLTTTASAANNYITVHVGGDVRMNGVY